MTGRWEVVIAYLPAIMLAVFGLILLWILLALGSVNPVYCQQAGPNCYDEGVAADLHSIVVVIFFGMVTTFLASAAVAIVTGMLLGRKQNRHQSVAALAARE